jgi:HEAT repeat protein
VDELQEKDPVAVEPEPVVAADEEDRPTFLVIAQFFLIPLVVISVAVGIFFLFGLMTGEPADPSQYLAEVRSGSKARRYQAAYELSKLLAYDKDAARDPAFVRELARLFSESAGAEPEMRRYLALALGQVADPATLDALVVGLDDPDAQTRIYTAWAVGAVGDARGAGPLILRLADADAGVRKTAAFALGGLRAAAAVEPLRGALDDEVIDVRWNAALALAQLGDAGALGVLRRMLDRSSLDGIEGITAEQKSEAMLNAIRGVALLGDVDSLDLLDRVAEADPVLEVRSAARTAASALRSSTAGR